MHPSNTHTCMHVHIHILCTQSDFCKQLFVIMHVSVCLCLCVCVCVIVKALLPVLYEIKTRGTRPRWQIQHDTKPSAALALRSCFKCFTLHIAQGRVIL